MIVLEVLKAHSKEDLGTYRFKHNEIRVSNRYQSQLILSRIDTNLNLRLIVEKDKAYFETNHELNFIKIAGKKRSGKGVIKVSDHLEVDGVEIKIHELSYTDLRKEIPLDRYEEKISTDGDVKELIFKVEDEIRKYS